MCYRVSVGALLTLAMVVTLMLLMIHAIPALSQSTSSVRVSNLDQPSSALRTTIGDDQHYAQSFCTGSVATTLDKVRLYTLSNETVPNAMFYRYDPAPVVTIRSTDAWGKPGEVMHTLTSPVTEDNAATFTVSLDSAPSGVLSVAVAVSETGNVLSDTAPSTLAFAAGERSKTLSLQTDDDDDESDSTVKVTLETGAGYTLGSRSSAVGSVTDNDEAPGGAAWGELLADRDIALGESTKPTDLWSDGSKVWVITDWETGQVRVYSLADGALQPDQGFTLTGTVFPAALWSDEQTLWVADYSGGRVLVYRLSDGSRLPAQDFDEAVISAADNNRPSGLWSDGQTMWVADFSASKVFAYQLSDKARASAKEFDLTLDQNGIPISQFGLWSDGETMLASDWQRG